MSRLRTTYRIWRSHDHRYSHTSHRAIALPPTTSEPTTATAAGPRVRQLSLEQKLPLLMTAVLVVVLTVSLALTERTLTRSARTRWRTARMRSRGIPPYGDSFRSATDSNRSNTSGQPSSPAVDAAILAAARTALDRLTAAADPGCQSSFGVRPDAACYALAKTRCP